MAVRPGEKGRCVEGQRFQPGDRGHRPEKVGKGVMQLAGPGVAVLHVKMPCHHAKHDPMFTFIQIHRE